MLPESPAHPASPPLSLVARKQALRAQVLAARDALPPALREAEAAAIAERVRALPSFRAATTVLLTLPFASEWNARPLADISLGTSKRVAMPRVDREARMLALHAIEDPQRDVIAGWQGIPEPRITTPVLAPHEIDWVLVPGVAFDATGRRLGYGGGFYDRLLPLLHSTVPRIAGAFELQIVDEVPAGPHDRRVDAIVSPTRTLVPAA